jgi:hypothetical protein
MLRRLLTSFQIISNQVVVLVFPLRLAEKLPVRFQALQEEFQELPTQAVVMVVLLVVLLNLCQCVEQDNGCNSK